MSVQFAAIPVRALSDARLTGSDFRLLGAIARYDRFGRNNTGCYVNARRLAADAAIHYKHLGRQTQRLEELGYITTHPSETDRRRKIYSVIYDEDEIVTCAGDNLAGGDASGDTAATLNEKVTTGGDYPPEIVTSANSQVIDPVAEPPPKRLSEANLRDPAKRGARTGEKASCATTPKTNHARQGDRGGRASGSQDHFMLPLQGGHQTPREQASEPDWNGWARWLSTQPGHDKYSALIWIGAEIERIVKDEGVDSTEAGATLDRELKRRRKAAA